MDVFEQFLLDHSDDDTARLLLGRAKWPSIDMDMAVHTIEGRRRIQAKVAPWYAVPSLRYPTRLCTEQCSSAATAHYKAALAARILADRKGRIADLTGGLGVDSWAFSEVAQEVLHNEMDPVLSEAVRHNFEKLGVRNMVFRNAAVVPAANLPAETAAGAANSVAGILDGFQPDLIFMDPARRAEDGRKVFRLEDCQPDVLTLLPELSEACPNLLLKISPMADISLVVSQLNMASLPTQNGGSTDDSLSVMRVREVHVVGAGGECKELLLWLVRNWNGPGSLHVSEIQDAEGSAATLIFPIEAETTASPVYASAIGLTGNLLFEPGKALAKAGLFHTISEHFGLRKLSRHTHLYLLPKGTPSVPEPTFITSETPPDASDKTDSVIADFGKVFRILEVHELSGRVLKTIGKTWPQAEVTARDIPLTSDDLRRRLGVRAGGNIHIFGCRIAGAPRLLVTERL